jgi:glycine/D-amino acid oxidase-like deaminating enzyme
MAETADVVIIGGGVIGASIALNLARRGVVKGWAIFEFKGRWANQVGTWHGDLPTSDESPPRNHPVRRF